MILEYKCNNCNQYFKLKYSAKDRGELNFLKKKMEEKCKHCNTKQELILNEIIARSNSWVKYLYLIALVISVTAFVITYNSITSESLKIHFRRYSFVLGLIFVVPFAIAANLVSSENRAVKRFNRFYV
jgi:DNA-directed RNA polymerase subunit RPC12/RpoP